MNDNWQLPKKPDYHRLKINDKAMTCLIYILVLGKVQLRHIVIHAGLVFPLPPVIRGRPVRPRIPRWSPLSDRTGFPVL